MSDARSHSCLEVTTKEAFRAVQNCTVLKIIRGYDPTTRSARLTLSNIEQAGLILSCYAGGMTTVRHYPETSPDPIESAFPGYPLGVWPAILSSFCRENATYETRHNDCSLPGCICPCHSGPTR